MTIAVAAHLARCPPELDIDLLAVVESTQRLPRRIAAANRVAEAQVLQCQAGIDRRGGAGRLRLALQSQHPVARILPRNGRHPRLLRGSQFQQVRPAAGGDDQIGFQARADWLHQHVDAQVGTAAAGHVAHDPAHGIADGHRHQFLARLKRHHGHAAHGHIDLIQRAIGEGPHLNRVDVALAGGRDARLGIGARNTHPLVGRFRRGLGVPSFGQQLQLRRHRQHLGHSHRLHRRKRLIDRDFVSRAASPVPGNGPQRRPSWRRAAFRGPEPARCRQSLSDRWSGSHGAR